MQLRRSPSKLFAHRPFSKRLWLEVRMPETWSTFTGNTQGLSKQDA